MKPKHSVFWLAAFLAIPVLYFITQFLPYYHAGGGALPSLGSLFWFPERNKHATDFIALFYPGFRVNELVSALLITQLVAFFLLIITPILKSGGVVAFILGGWGVFGLVAFLTTRSLSFSPVMVYGGYAGILMLALFLAAIILSAVFFFKMYKNYRQTVSILKSGDRDGAGPLS